MYTVLCRCVVWERRVCTEWVQRVVIHALVGLYKTQSVCNEFDINVQAHSIKGCCGTVVCTECGIIEQ